jgi:hypothetical protein
VTDDDATDTDDMVVVVGPDPLLQSVTTIAGYDAIVHLPGDYDKRAKQPTYTLSGLTEAATGNVYDLVTYGPSAFIAQGNPWIYC